MPIFSVHVCRGLIYSDERWRNYTRLEILKERKERETIDDKNDTKISNTVTPPIEAHVPLSNFGWSVKCAYRGGFTVFKT